MLLIILTIIGVWVLTVAFCFLMVYLTWIIEQGDKEDELDRK